MPPVLRLIREYENPSTLPLQRYNSPSTNPIAPAATANAAIAIPVSTTAPPAVTPVGQSIELELVLIDIVLPDISCMLDVVDVTVIVEFIAILAVLVIVELESEKDIGIELVVGGEGVVELAALAEGKAAGEEDMRPAPTLVPQ